jgi:hypothetical protein
LLKKYNTIFNVSKWLEEVYSNDYTSGIRRSCGQILLKFSHNSILPCTAFPSTLASMLELSPPLPILLLPRVGGLELYINIFYSTEPVWKTELNIRLYLPCTYNVSDVIDGV